MRQVKYVKMTDVERADYKRRVCVKCKYSSTRGRDSKMAACTTCDYILYTGKPRPCNVGKCKEEGVFVKKGKRRIQYISFCG